MIVYNTTIIQVYNNNNNTNNIKIIILILIQVMTNNSILHMSHKY